jgi:hypothetical protein
MGKSRNLVAVLSGDAERVDVKTFADLLLAALNRTDLFEQVTLQADGPVADGYAYVHANLFLRFYYNESTGTMAFALIHEKQRIWGIDTDNRRGWHLHPSDDPKQHIRIDPLLVNEIVERLEIVLQALG